MRFNQYPLRSVARWSLAPLSMLAVASCGSGDSSSDTPPAAATAAAPAERISTIAADQPMITFDFLGGGSKVIMVFPGVTETEEDKKYNGTYYDGEQMPALCQTIGRVVTSDPSMGELEKSSDVWIKIVDEPGDSNDQFATLTYASIPEEDLASVGPC